MRDIVTPLKFYSLMSSADMSSILSTASFIVSAFNHRKKLMQDFADG